MKKSVTLTIDSIIWEQAKEELPQYVAFIKREIGV